VESFYNTESKIWRVIRIFRSNTNFFFILAQIKGYVTGSYGQILLHLTESLYSTISAGGEVLVPVQLGEHTPNPILSLSPINKHKQCIQHE
jgi:hypothetical protein